MKTKLNRLFVTLALLALPVLAQAQFTFTTNSGAITITGYNPAAGLNVVIPASTNGYPVTAIGTDAFAGLATITNVTIPDSVTSIGDYVFDSCTGLTRVTTGNSVTSIGNYAFEFCSSLTSVTFPNSITSIGMEAFADCPGLASVAIPNGVTSISYETFIGCTGLTNVAIPDSVTDIGESVFENCFNLTSMTIPASVTSIGHDAFLGCRGLTNIAVNATNPYYASVGGVLFDKSLDTLIEFPGGLAGSYAIPNSVTNIGDAFAGCSLTSVTIPDSVISIGYEAFISCTGLTSVTIPNSVTSIGEAAFFFCSGLTSVTIGNSVTSIGESAFEGCSLTSVMIPNSVTSIGAYAFCECYGLTKVYFTGNAPSPTNDSTVFSGDPAMVYYLPGTTGWGALFDGLPTAPWFLPNPQILDHSAGFGVHPGGFGFTISWATNTSVVVEAATNLANPVWIPVSTNTLTGGTNYFSDPQWTNYPGRFYRITSRPTFPGFTGNLDVDMYNAAVADGTAHGGIPAVMYTEDGGPFNVTAVGPYSHAVSLRYAGYAGGCKLIVIAGTGSCSSTTLPSGPAIQFGHGLVCGFGPYGY